MSPSIQGDRKDSTTSRLSTRAQSSMTASSPKNTRTLVMPALIDDWKARVHAGQTAEVVAELLEKHYDPGYQASTSRNFRHYPQALALSPAGPGEKAMTEAAGLLQRQATVSLSGFRT